MSERIDYDEMAAAYDAGRAKPKAWLDGWREVLNRYMAGLSGPVLDLGSGTGIWSLLLAEWFDLDVIGMEPSAGMRSQAVRKRSHARVRYLGGEAEHLPLRDDSCAAAWLSTVIHHIGDLETAVPEVRRVLQPDGPVLIRNAFSGRDDEVLWLRYFPSAHALANERWPTVAATVEAFAAGGFHRESLQRIHEFSAANLMEYCKKVETRADSSLTLISDEEFERGLEELRKAAETEPPSPVTTGLDLLVLR